MSFQKILRLLFIITISVIFICLSYIGTRPGKENIISGKLKGLPDGKMYLLDEHGVSIDSTFTKSGVFSFEVPKRSYKEPILLTLAHGDQKNCKRFFNFPTNRLYHGSPWMDEYFMLDDSITINGNLKEFLPKDFKLTDTVKLVYPDKFYSHW